jgi:hypothetical protein
MMDTDRKAALLERYKKKLAELESKTDEFPDLVYYTVAFAKKHGLTGSDMEPVIPKDLLECSMPTVLDMIDATGDFELE